MGRLTNLKGRLAVQGGRVQRMRTHGEAGRDAIVPWRAWYKTKQWQQLRWKVLVAALFTCARCGLVTAEKRALVADHKVPHRGDAALFWDEANLQCLCAECHAGAKQAEEFGR